MRKRIEEFALSLHLEKTRLIEFGRFAAVERNRRGLGKPETLNFLGFTHICGRQGPQSARRAAARHHRSDFADGAGGVRHLRRRHDVAYGHVADW